MRRAVVAAAICCLLLNIGIAQVNSTPSLEPTPLEAFAGRPTAHLTWSEVIGGLESQESRATVIALVVEDKTSDPSVMRGIRVDLAHIGATPGCDWKYWSWRIMCERANAAIYIEEGRLERVRDGVRRGAAELRPMEFISKYSMTASGKETTGLIVCGYTLSERQPAELAELFTSAIAKLKGAPR
jgi:hypothetical protein